MKFGRGVLTIILMATSFDLSVGNIFENKNRSIQLSNTFYNDRNVMRNKEIWNLAEDHIKSIMIARDDSYDLTLHAPCSSPSALWLEEQTAMISSDDLNKIMDWNLFIIPFAYKLYVDAPGKNIQNYSKTVSIMDFLTDNEDMEEYFGPDGEYTEEIRDIFHQARDFWSGSGVADEIHIRGAHGSDLADEHKLIPTLELLFEDSYDKDYTVHDHANEIQDLIMRLPGGYDFPLLTFNAFATDEMNGVDPSIIIGDGYFEFQKASRSESEGERVLLPFSHTFRNVLKSPILGLYVISGPEYVLTHEFAHHVMYAMDLSLEEYKKEELMADAFAAYFLANNNGGDMSSSEISNIHQVAFSVGDCKINDNLHHGTPRQRTCATIWGATFADSDEGRNLNARQLYSGFNNWYSAIEELDEDCTPLSSVSSSKRVHFILLLMIPVAWYLY